MNAEPDELQRPPHVATNPSTERFSENKSEYFKFQSDMNSCFKKDCEKFLLAFEKLENLTFRAFGEVWKKMSFGLIFAGQEFIDELEWFMESAFFTVKEFLMFSESIYVQVGAFYMLYALYFKQPCGDKIKIRLTSEEYTLISALPQKIYGEAHTEFKGIFIRLECMNAFCYVAKPRRYGLEGKFMWQEKEPKGDIFQSTKKADAVQDVADVLYSADFYGLSHLSKVDQEYTKTLKECGISTSDHQTASVAEELKLLCDRMKQSPSSPRKQKCDKEETIDAKRAKLRSKAFSASVPAVRSFKTENTDK